MLCRRASRTALALLTLGLADATARATDVFWMGLNTAALYDHTQGLGTEWTKSDYASANAATAPDGYKLWSSGGVPGTGDTAVFQWDTAETSVWGYAEADVLITNGFAPDHIVLRCTSQSYPDNSEEARVVVDGDVSVQTLTLDINASGVNGSNGGNVYRIAGGVFRLSGAVDPVRFAGPHGAWQSIEIGSAGTLAFDAPQQSFGAFGWFWSGWNGEMRIGGTGAIEFPRPAAEIILPAPGNKTSGNIAAGQCAFRVRSDQTWLNPSRTGYVTRQVVSNGRLAESIDGGALHNLSNVAFRVLSYSGASPYYVPTGTYQGLHLRAYTLTAGRDCTYRLTGDIGLRGGVVTPGTASVPAFETDYGLQVSGESSSSAYLELLGYDAVVDRSVFIDSRPYYQNHTFGKARITGTLGSTLSIAGDLLIRVTNFTPGTTNATGVLTEAVGSGIAGDETFTLNLGGNFSVNARSVSGSRNLSAATVNLLGGTAGAPATWEVGCDPADLCDVSTFSVNTLNVGTNGHPAQVRLTNEFLNDNDRQNPLKSKDGEILVADKVRVADGSTLDLNGLGLKVVSSLDVAPTGTLDLDTGVKPIYGTVYANVAGLGNQADDWNAFADRVVDSSYPIAGFKAVHIASDAVYPTPVGGDTRLAFDGVNDYVEVPADGLGTQTISALTVECWVRVTSNPGGWAYAVHRSKDQNIGSSVYYLGVIADDGKHKYAAGVNGKYAVGDTGVAIDDQWHHLALTYDGSAQAVYLDGVLKATATVGAIGNQRTGNRIGFGSTPFNASNRPVGGNICEVRVWNLARSAAEILAAKDAKLTGNESGLVGYWPMDEGVGTTVADASANNNTGTLCNGLEWERDPGMTYWQVTAPLAATLLLVR
jgi:hypothetical protein